MSKEVSCCKLAWCVRAFNCGLIYMYVCVDQNTLACEKHGRPYEGKGGASTNGAPVGDALYNSPHSFVHVEPSTSQIGLVLFYPWSSDNACQKNLGPFYVKLCCENVMAVELSVWIGVPEGGCVRPNSIHVISMRTAYWTLMKMPPISASEAEAGTQWMVLTSTWTGPLGLMDVGLEVVEFERVYNVAQMLLESGRTKYDLIAYIIPNYCFRMGN